MHEAGVRRLVALATVSVPDPRDRPRLLDHFLVDQIADERFVGAAPAISN